LKSTETTESTDSIRATGRISAISAR